MRKIGVHLRITNTMADVAAYALSLNVPIFQCFLIHQETRHLISLSDQEIQIFLRDWRPKFEQLFVHGSYWINLANIRSENRVISREIELAKKLAFNYIVVHPGSVTKGSDKHKGIAAVARNLNIILKHEQTIKIILENAAHAGVCIGGDLHDFFLLKKQLDYPEKVLFCLDTAHAFVYGYDITTNNGLSHFIELVDTTIGLTSVVLIHLNDTKQECGSRIDRHEKVGTGLLADVLPTIVQHSALKHIPLITELPTMNFAADQDALTTIRNWNGR